MLPGKGVCQMPENNSRDKDNKVLPIDQWLRARQQGEDSLSQLLNHMRQVREVVPVNRRLQEELRKKLLEQQEKLRESGQLTTAPVIMGTVPEPSPKCSRWLKPAGMLVLAVLLIAAVVGLWRHAGGEVILQPVGLPQEITRFWAEDQPLYPAVSPDGQQILVVRGGRLVLLSASGMQVATLDPPEGGYFRSPTWSPDGHQVAFVVGSHGVEEIQQLPVVNLTSGGSKFSNLKPKDNSQWAKPAWHYANLTFSPGGDTLAYVVKRAGEPAEVWVKPITGQARLVTQGDYPAWSPDGKHLVVQQPDKENSYVLYLVDIKTGDTQLLGPGERPTWSKNGYLAFVTQKTQERILTFMPDGEPQYSVRQQVPEIRAVYLGNDGSAISKRLRQGQDWLAGSNLLVAAPNQVSGLEINWLRQQEMDGSGEPKTLVLKEINQCEGQVFGPDGKWLLFARRNGDTVALVKVMLEQQWKKRRD